MAGAILQQSHFVAIANVSSSVRISKGGSTDSVISTDGYPIARLRAYLNLNDNATKNDPGVHWGGNAVESLGYHLDVPDEPLSTTIYWANWNPEGLHWYQRSGPNYANCHIEQSAKDVMNMRLWAR